MQTACIYCRRHVPRSQWEIQHIIPDSLGCPKQLVLKHGEVCRSCGNRISKAERKLLEALALVRPFIGAKTKKGKHPPPATFANGSIGRNDAGMFVQIKRHVPGELECDWSPLQLDPSAFTYRAPIALDARVSRGLHKIALEFVCWKRGRTAVLNAHFDPVRSYVLGTSGGFRRILVCADIDPTAEVFPNGVLPELLGAEDDGPLVQVRLGRLDFVVCVGPSDIYVLEAGTQLNRAVGRRMLMTMSDRGISEDPSDVLARRHAAALHRP